MRPLIVCSLLLYGCLLYAVRDPFLRTDGQHAYAYTAFGELHGTPLCFAMLFIDGLCYQVKKGDCVAEHEIIAVTASEVCVKNSRGKEILIFLQKKSPST